MEGELAERATARKVVLALDTDEPATRQQPHLPDNPAYQHILTALADAGEPRRARDPCRTLDLGIAADRVVPLARENPKAGFSCRRMYCSIVPYRNGDAGGNIPGAVRRSPLAS